MGARAGCAVLLLGSLALACSRPETEKEPEKPAARGAQEARTEEHPARASEGPKRTAGGHGAGHETAVGLEPMQHAFFLVGEEHPFLVHMTNMWMDAHLYQVVLRVTFPREMWEAYTRHRDEETGAKADDWYIVGNVAGDEMTLPDLARGAKRSFRASLWRGWPTKAPEEGSHWPWSATPPIVEDFEVRIERVVQYRHFDWNLQRPTSLTYFLFGEGDEAHMQSYQIKQPDFDHVLSLSGPPSGVAPALLEAGVHVNFPSVAAQPAKPPHVYCEPPSIPAAPMAPLVPATTSLKPSTPATGATPATPAKEEASQEHLAQLAGQEQLVKLKIDRHVFFGTYPVNQTDPCKELAGAASVGVVHTIKAWRGGTK